MARRVLPSDWKTKPFIDPHSARRSLTLRRSQYAKMLLGFRPVDMDDKWFVCAVKEMGGQSTLVKFYRSWTGFLVAEIEVVVGREGPKVVGIRWEESEEVVKDHDEKDAKETVRDVCKHVLDVELGVEE